MSTSLKKSKVKVWRTIENVFKWGSVKVVGRMAMEVKELLYKAMIMPMILSNTESWGTLKKKEIETMERIQKNALIRLFEQKSNLVKHQLIVGRGVGTPPLSDQSPLSKNPPLSRKRDPPLTNW